jgi:hypothetical protein
VFPVLQERERMPLSVATCPEVVEAIYQTWWPTGLRTTYFRSLYPLPNVDSIFFDTRHAISAMVETAGDGAIVNVSSSQR